MNEEQSEKNMSAYKLLNGKKYKKKETKPSSLLARRGRFFKVDKIFLWVKRYEVETHGPSVGALRNQEKYLFFLGRQFDAMMFHL